MGNDSKRQYNNKLYVLFLPFQLCLSLRSGTWRAHTNYNQKSGHVESTMLVAYRCRHKAILLLRWSTCQITSKLTCFPPHNFLPSKQKKTKNQIRFQFRLWSNQPLERRCINVDAHAIRRTHPIYQLSTRHRAERWRSISLPITWPPLTIRTA